MEETNSSSVKPQNNRNIIIGLFVLLICGAIGFGVFMSGGIGYLTYDNYIQIQDGMTYSQVVEILNGHEGELSTSGGYGGYSLKYYTWSNMSGTKCIVVGFENGRVCTKTQYGLH